MRDDSRISKAVEGELNADKQGGAPYPFVRIQTGQVMCNDALVAYLRSAESQGLLRLDESQSVCKVTPTPKLLAVAVTQTQAAGSEAAPSTWLQVTIAKHTVDKITTKQDYNGPLASASPGEKHLLVLGVFSRVPTSAARVVGGDLARQETDRFRFRAVVKYSEFKKEWSVLAIDAGVFDSDEVWFTKRVQ